MLNQATDHLLLRKGKKNNAIVFQDSDYDKTALVESGDNLVFTHSVLGAEKSRYSVNFGKNWTEWKDWEDSTTIPKSEFKNKKFFWKGNHVIMNCEPFSAVQWSSTSDRLRLLQIGRRPRALPLPSCTLISDMTYPVESLVSLLEEISTDSVSIPMSPRN